MGILRLLGVAKLQSAPVADNPRYASAKTYYKVWCMLLMMMNLVVVHKKTKQTPWGNCCSSFRYRMCI